MVKDTLENCCVILKGKTPIKWSEPGEYPLVTTAEEIRTSNKFDFKGPAVCVPMISSTGHGHASIKRIHYQKGQFALASIMCALFSKDEKILLTEYLYIYLILLKEEVLVPLMRGSANVSLTITSLKKVEVCIPSLSIQRKLINLYKTTELQFSRIKNNLKQQEDNIGKLEEAILYECFSGVFSSMGGSISEVKKILKEIYGTNRQISRTDLKSLGKNEGPFKVPKDWLWCTLGEISEKIGAGSTPKGGKSVYVDEGVFFLRSQNIKNNIIDFSDAVMITDEVHNKMKGTQVLKDDILLNITGASIGRSAILNENNIAANVSQHVAIIRLINAKLNKYVQLYISSPIFKEEIERVQTGISREGLSMRELQKLQIPICSYAQQDQIIKKIDSFLKFKIQLIERFKKTALDTQHLFENIFNSFFLENLKTQTFFISSPFSFPSINKFNEQDDMASKQSKIVRGKITHLDINVLKQEFGISSFSFNDIFARTSLGYDLLKDVLFDLLENKDGNSSHISLRLVFDDEHKNIIFKIH